MTTTGRLCNQTHYTTATSSSLTCWHTGWPPFNKSWSTLWKQKQRPSEEAARLHNKTHTPKKPAIIWRGKWEPFGKERASVMDLNPAPEMQLTRSLVADPRLVTLIHFGWMTSTRTHIFLEEGKKCVDKLSWRCWHIRDADTHKRTGR